MIRLSYESRVYHVMSHTALDGFPLGDIEKDFMLDLIRRYAALYFVEILGFCLMGNRFLCKALHKTWLRIEAQAKHGVDDSPRIFL